MIIMSKHIDHEKMKMTRRMTHGMRLAVDKTLVTVMILKQVTYVIDWLAGIHTN